MNRPNRYRAISLTRPLADGNVQAALLSVVQEGARRQAPAAGVTARVTGRSKADEEAGFLLENREFVGSPLAARRSEFGAIDGTPGARPAEVQRL